MTQSFTDDDLEKRVENANGEVIGTVTAVEGDSARVEPSAGVMDSIRAALGWERAHEDTVVIHASTIGERTADVIRLEADEPSQDDPATSVEERERGQERERKRAQETERDRDQSVDIGGPDELDAETGLEADGTAERESIGDDDAHRMGRPEESVGADVQEQDPDSDSNSDPDQVPVDEARAVEGMDGTGELEPEPEPGPELDSESDSESDRDPDPETTEMSSAEEMGPVGETSESESRDVADVVDDADLVDDTADADEATETVTEGTTGERGESAPDSAAELSPGVDVDSLEEASRTEDEGEAADDGDEGVETEPNATADLSQGVDTDSLEAASETGTRDDEPSVDPGTETEPTAEAIDPTDELDQGVDIESIEQSTELDETDETESTPWIEGRDPADELDPGVDVGSLEEPDHDSSGTVDPETLDEGRTAAELGLETAARRIGPEIDPGTEMIRLAGEETADSGAEADVEGDGTAESGAADRERDRIPGHAASPVAATFDAQRTAIERGQQVVERGMDANQRIARTTLEGQARIQRRSLEIFQAATAGYFETVAATMRAASDRGSSGDRPDAEQFTQQLQDHLERIQELQDLLDEQVDRQHERTAELLEEQLERVDRIQQELSATGLERVDGLDPMYRERLEAAEITSLDELARADTETVADAADVTEKRAESWIEQAEV